MACVSNPHQRFTPEKPCVVGDVAFEGCLRQLNGQVCRVGRLFFFRTAITVQ